MKKHDDERQSFLPELEPGDREPTEQEWEQFKTESRCAVERVEREGMKPARRPALGIAAAAIAFTALIFGLGALLVTSNLFRNQRLIQQAYVVAEQSRSVSVERLEPGDKFEVTAGCTATVYLPNGEQVRFNDELVIEYVDGQVTTEEKTDGPVIGIPASQWITALMPLSINTRASANLEPEPVYPIDTAVLPEEVELRWRYSGRNDTVVVNVFGSDGETVLSEELSADQTALSLTVEPGQSYSWNVCLPDGVSRKEGFRVVDAEQYQSFQTTLLGLGLSEDAWLEELRQSNDLAAVAAMYQLAASLELNREADVLRERLLELVESAQM